MNENITTDFSTMTQKEAISTAGKNGHFTKPFAMLLGILLTTGTGATATVVSNIDRLETDVEHMQAVQTYQLGLIIWHGQMLEPMPEKPFTLIERERALKILK